MNACRLPPSPVPHGRGVGAGQSGPYCMEENAVPTPPRRYTRSEKTKRAGLLARGIKQALAGADAIDPRIERKIDRLDARAEDRYEREITAHIRQLDAARSEAAAARARERAAAPSERSAARRDRQAAEEVVKRAERALKTAL